MFTLYFGPQAQKYRDFLPYCFYFVFKSKNLEYRKLLPIGITMVLESCELQSRLRHAEFRII